MASQRDSSADDLTAEESDDVTDVEGSACSGDVRYSRAVVLPPCRVCGSAASGFHYGVNTCEACKGFFRRAGRKSSTFFCKDQNNCDITGDNRNSCASCRYRRCLFLGMSRDAIKTGRYTHEKRTRDTLEVRMLTTSPDGSDRLSLQWTAEEIDAILQDLLQAGEATGHLCTRHRSAEDILLLEMTSRDKFSPLKDPLPDGLFTDVSQSLRQLPGMETDGSRAIIMADEYAFEVERLLRNFTRFLKCVPGFSQLFLRDQTDLLRISWLEMVLLGNTLTPGMGVARVKHTCNVTCLNSSIVANVIGADFIHTLSAGEHRLRKLSLTSDELTLTQALYLTSPDRCDLENRGQVEHLQWLLVRCLMHVLGRNHGQEAGRKFSDVITHLTYLRDVAEELGRIKDMTTAAAY